VPGELEFDHCVIAVSDWDRSNAFYRDVLGAEVDQKDQWFGHYRFEGLAAKRPRTRFRRAER
jgi:catechol 2,3-dioxygenase-like lactoylglutathione lyase family enzyme